MEGFVLLVNIVVNAKVTVMYIVEADQSKWETTKENSNLEKTTFLQPDEADKVRSG